MMIKKSQMKVKIHSGIFMFKIKDQTACTFKVEIMICLILLFLLSFIKLIRKRNLFNKILLLKARNSKFLKRQQKRKKQGLERTPYLEI